MTSTLLDSEVQWGKDMLSAFMELTVSLYLTLQQLRAGGEKALPTKGRKFPLGRRDPKVYHWPFSPQLMLPPGAQEFPVCSVKGEEGTEHALCSLSPSSPLPSLTGLTQTHTLHRPAEMSPPPSPLTPHSESDAVLLGRGGTVGV